MKSFDVDTVCRPVNDDLDEAYSWAAQRAPATAAVWQRRFEDSLRTLEHHPQRCGVAPESAKARSDLRELHFGRRPNVFRVVFKIDGDLVRVLRIQRAQRRRFKRHELE